MGSCLPCCKKEDDYSINAGEDRQRLIPSGSEDEEHGTEYESSREEFSTPQGEYSTSHSEYHTPLGEPCEEYSTDHQLSLRYNHRNTAPRKMERGAVAVHGTIAYIIGRNSRTLYRYQSGEDRWREHSQCPHVNPGLALINDMLTAVGGKERGRATNKLVSWNEEKWVEEFPPMKTPREEPAVVSHGLHVVALGGDVEQRGVEVFNVSSSLWTTVTSLPTPAPRITAALCHGYIMAMTNDGYAMSTNFPVTDSAIRSIQWKDLPYKRFVGPTLTAFCGQTVVAHNNGLHQLCGRKWVEVGSTPLPVMYSIVWVVDDQMVVVGGDMSYTSAVLIITE